MKKLPPLSKEKVKEAFGTSNLEVFDNSAEMFRSIKNNRTGSSVYLFMSSGDFDGCNILSIAEELVNQDIKFL